MNTFEMLLATMFCGNRKRKAKEKEMNVSEKKKRRREEEVKSVKNLNLAFSMSNGTKYGKLKLIN